MTRAGCGLVRLQAHSHYPARIYTPTTHTHAYTNSDTNLLTPSSSEQLGGWSTALGAQKLLPPVATTALLLQLLNLQRVRHHQQCL